MLMKSALNNRNPVDTLVTSAGFTVMELLIVSGIIGILAAISIPLYKNFTEKAKITVAQATLQTVRLTLVDYSNERRGSYPSTIDFSSGLDDLGQTVIQQPLREQIKKDLVLPSINYASSASGFTLSAQANNKTHTVLILTENTLKIQGQ